MAAFCTNEGRHPTQTCHSPLRSFYGRFLIGAVAQCDRCTAGRRPKPSLVPWPMSGGDVAVSCPSLPDSPERLLTIPLYSRTRPIAVVQVWNLLSLLTCPKPPMFFGSFKILRSFCSRPSLGLQQSAWHSAATDLKWHKRIDFGADVPFGWLGAQLFSIPRCTLCTRSHCQQYPQRSHTAERHQQDCGP